MDLSLQQWTEDALRRSTGVCDADVSWQPLRVEASHRRFYRVRAAGAEGLSWVAMGSPPALENNAQLIVLAELFHRHRIGVPEIVAQDEERGFFLMSDLGDLHFEAVYAGPGPAAVMPAALATLHLLQGIDDPAVPPYTRERFQDELRIYQEWFLGRLLDTASTARLEPVFATLIDATQAQPACCVHRDFHCRNLLITPDERVGVVDFQDALMGPATYDLASLLRDCYYRFPEPAVRRWCRAYLAGTALPVDQARFAHDLDLTALQRQLKAVGIFARLSLRDGRDSHLHHILPVLNRIGALADQYRETRALADHVADVLPAARRRLGNGP